MTTLIVVQARTGSTRFPGKVLADLGGEPLLGFMLERLRPLTSDPDIQVAVATSDRDSDDAVADLARDRGFPAVRGSEADVLSRFAAALDELPADDVVRLTADCPLMDPAVVTEVLGEHRRAGADYTSNTLARTYPDGLDVEVVAAPALRAAVDRAQAPEEREHVTPHLQRWPETFLLAQHLTDELAGDERWTVDNPADLAIIQEAIRATDDPHGATWTALLDRLGRRHQAEASVRPMRVPAHRRGGPFVRRWQVDDDAGSAGTATVEVRGGGSAHLTVEGLRPATVERVVRERLRADRQVTTLTTDEGARAGSNPTA